MVASPSENHRAEGRAGLQWFAFIGVVVACVVCVNGQQLPDLQWARTTAIVPVRLLPDPEGIPLIRLAPGTEVKVLGREGEWVHIEFSDRRYGNRVGYVLAAGLTAYHTRNVGDLRPTDTEPAKVVESNALPNGEIPSETIVVYASLSAAEIARSIEIGQGAKGAHGLFLQDAADVTFPTLGSLWKGAATEPDLRVQLFTPLAWIRQLASDAAEDQRAYTVADVTAETLEPVLRVVAIADVRATVPEVAAVRHVELRELAGRRVVQPLLSEPVSEVVYTPDERITREGLAAKFLFEYVDELRGPRRDQAFYVTVTRATGAARSFKVTSAQLDTLP